MSNQRTMNVYIALGLSFGLSLYCWLAYQYWPIQYIRLISEDNVGELLTAICMLAGSFLVFTEALRRRRSGDNAWLMWMFAIFLFVLGAEEISWGSRILGFQIPFIQSHNLQNEVNLHNLQGIGFRRVEKYFAPLVLFFGVLLPILFVLHPDLRRLRKKVALPVAGMEAVPLFLASAAFRSDTAFLIMDKPGEIAEMMLGLGLLVMSAELAGKRFMPETLRIISTCLLFTLLWVLLGPNQYRETHEHWRRWMFSEVSYPDRGLVKPATILLNQKIANKRSELEFGSSQAADLMSRLVGKTADGQRVKGAESVKNALLLDILNSRLNLSLLARLHGQSDESEWQLLQARALYSGLDKRRTAAHHLLAAQIKILCLEGRMKEAREALKRTNASKINRFHRISLSHYIKRFQRITAVSGAE